MKLPPEVKNRRALGAALDASLSVDQLITLELTPGPELTGAARHDALGALVLKLLADEAARRELAKREKFERRPALIMERFARTLARSILPVQGEWASVARSELERCYKVGPPARARLFWHDTHPGSSAGLVVLDFRKPEEWQTTGGQLTEASVLARVRGEPRPA